MLSTCVFNSFVFLVFSSKQYCSSSNALLYKEVLAIVDINLQIIPKEKEPNEMRTNENVNADKKGIMNDVNNQDENLHHSLFLFYLPIQLN